MVQSEAPYLEPVLGLVVGVVGGVGELGHVLLEVVHEGAEGDGQHTGDGQQQVATHILHGLLYELSPKKTKLWSNEFQPICITCTCIQNAPDTKMNKETV